MSLFHLSGGAPRRAPYSDWRAQVIRILERRGHGTVELVDCDALKACYDYGLTAAEIANTWEDSHDSH